jgi:hypothetical protein
VEKGGLCVKFHVKKRGMVFCGHLWRSIGHPRCTKAGFLSGPWSACVSMCPCLCCQVETSISVVDNKKKWTSMRDYHFCSTLLLRVRIWRRQSFRDINSPEKVGEILWLMRSWIESSLLLSLNRSIHSSQSEWCLDAKDLADAGNKSYFHLNYLFFRRDGFYDMV